MEIEVRILDIDIEDIRKKLFENNAVLVKKENQINKLFDFEDGRLLNSKGYARIRIIEDLISNESSFYMTVKKKISSNNDKYKIMDEKEIKISDSFVGEEIFKSLGLRMTCLINRYRESYKIFDVLVEIDVNDKSFYPNPYIEIEGNCTKNIEKVVNILGYSMEDTTSKSIFDILKERNQN